MRKHSVRKFIHAVLDCLPLLVIPIFAIYSQNHEINDNTLQVQENLKVDFNQKGKNTFGTGFGGITKTDYSSYMHFEGTITSLPVGNRVYGNPLGNVFGHIFLIDFRISGTTTNTSNTYPYIVDGYIGNQCNISTGHLQYRTNGNQNNLIACLYCGVVGDTIDIDVAYEYFDLTQMFGSGNEPTIAEFNQWFNETYYQYTESKEVIIDNYETITYNDTDIMSQFMYVTYNAVDKYFNMNRVFNLGNIWNWVQNTLFNGSAPLSAFIVYNVIMYEFIMDIIFLVYLVLMFVIDFAESGIDRFMKRGVR